MINCEMCAGPSGVIGTLGDLDWFSCRNCGWEQHRPADAGWDDTDEPDNSDEEPDQLR